MNFKTSRTESGLKVELYHADDENHINGPEKKLPKGLKVGEFYPIRCTYKDVPEDKTKLTHEIDFKDDKGFVRVNEWTVKLPKQFMDKALFEKRSYFWLRINNDDTGSVSFRNVKLTKL